METLAGPPAKRPASAVAMSMKKRPQPDARRQHAEQHVVEHVGRHHAERDAVDALAGEVEVVDDALPGVAGVGEDAGQRGPEQRVDHQHDGDDRQRRADAAPRRLQQHHDHDGAHDPVDRVGIADAELQVVEDPGNVEGSEHGGDRQRPVDQGRCRAAREGWRRAAACWSCAAPRTRERSGPARRRDGCRGGWSRAAGRSRPCSSGSRRATNSSPDNQPGGGGQQRPELHLRIELGLELLQVRRQLRQRVRLGHWLRGLA